MSRDRAGARLGGGRAVWHAGVRGAAPAGRGARHRGRTTCPRGAELAVLALLAAGAASYALLGVPRCSCAVRPAGGRLHIAIARAGRGRRLRASTRPSRCVFFVVYAQLWALLEYREAVAAAAVLTVGLGVVGVLALDVPVPIAVLQTVVALVASVLLGTWISRIIEQSGQRADVIAELRARPGPSWPRSATRPACWPSGSGWPARSTTPWRRASPRCSCWSSWPSPTWTPTRRAARRRLAVARQTARQNLAEARSLVAALTPVDLQAAPLPEAVGRLVDRFGREDRAAGDAGGRRRGRGRCRRARRWCCCARRRRRWRTSAGTPAGARWPSRSGTAPAGTELAVADDGGRLRAGRAARTAATGWPACAGGWRRSAACCVVAARRLPAPRSG